MRSRSTSIGGVGVSVSLTHNGLSVVRVRGSSPRPGIKAKIAHIQLMSTIIHEELMS